MEYINLKYINLVFLISLFFIISCAQIDVPPENVNLCEVIDISCPPNFHCEEVNGGVVCVGDALPIEVCDLDCPPGQSCLFGACHEENMDGDVCEFPGTRDICEEGSWCIGSHCTPIECEPGETVRCYSGPPGTLREGAECRAGYHLCSTDLIFTEECIGEVTPREEVGLLACNGLDDDCDGITDSGDLREVDIVFVFDISGSMSPYLLAVASAISDTAALYDAPEVRLGLVFFPNPYSPTGEETPTKIIEMLPYEDFNDRLPIALAGLSTFGGSEASYDAPFMIANNLVPRLNLRPEVQTVIVMFTDEEGQSYQDDLDGTSGCAFQRDLSSFMGGRHYNGTLCDLSERSMCRAIREEDVKLYTFVRDDEAYHGRAGESPQYIPYYEYFDDCSTIFYLSDDPALMVANLHDLAEHICE